MNCVIPYRSMYAFTLHVKKKKRKRRGGGVVRAEKKNTNRHTSKIIITARISFVVPSILDSLICIGTHWAHVCRNDGMREIKKKKNRNEKLNMGGNPTQKE